MAEYEGKEPEDEGKEPAPPAFPWLPAGCEPMADGEYDAIVLGTGLKERAAARDPREARMPRRASRGSAPLSSRPLSGEIGADANSRRRIFPPCSKID